MTVEVTAFVALGLRRWVWDFKEDITEKLPITRRVLVANPCIGEGLDS